METKKALQIAVSAIQNRITINTPMANLYRKSKQESYKDFSDKLAEYEQALETINKMLEVSE
jgi:hypothetical protein